jgi:hypothetical protein
MASITGRPSEGGLHLDPIGVGGIGPFVEGDVAAGLAYAELEFQPLLRLPNGLGDVEAIGG